MNQQVFAYGISIDSVTMAQAVNLILNWVDQPSNKSCRYVVTPNVDHVVQLRGNEAFQRAYQSASLVLTDGRPVYFSLFLLGKKVPEVVSGSDLVPALFSTCQTQSRPLNVFLLGAAPGVAQQASKKIVKKWPCIKISGIASPPVGFEKSDRENTTIINQINTCRPDVIIVGLGAPKQECWMQMHSEKIQAPAALCVGATIDFLAGHSKRAPVWMRKLSLEWSYRMIKEPGRLIKRYATNFRHFPGLFLKEWRMR